MRKIALGVVGVALFGIAAACGGSGDAVPEDAPAADGGLTGEDGSAEVTDGGAGDDAASRADAAADAGDADADADSGPAPVVTATFAKAIAAGEDVVCILTQAGALRCWGANAAPLELGGAGSTWKDVSVGGLRRDGWVTLCAVRSDDALFCWGDTTATPTQPDPGTFASVGLSNGNRCAITTAGALTCWGNNNVFGPLGTGDTNPRATPTPIGDATDWKRVAPGKDHTCAIKQSGALFCWGWNAFGEVGDGLGQQTVLSPVAVDAANTYVDVSARNVATCGVRTDGTLACWGTSGTLGINAATPKALDAAKDWAEVRLSVDHACAVKKTGALYCWGNNDRGQAAVAVTSGTRIVSTPQRVGLDTDWEHVAVAPGVSCATKKSGTVWCWGADGRGQLAQAPYGHLAPTRIGAAGEFASVNAGPYSVCATRKNGTLACWGRTGAVAATGLSVQTPVNVTAATDWKSGKPGFDRACATKTDGSLYCWSNGGVPSATNLTPTSWDVGASHQCAVVAGSLYCWGAGIFGKLGNGSNNDLAAPTKVGVDAWKAVATTENTSCGIKADGTLVCFGFGYTGFAKQGNATTWSALEASSVGDMYAGLQGAGSPLYRWGFAVAVASTGMETDLVQVAAGERHFCAIRSGGTLWCKGENEQGQLGDGTLDRRFDLVQVGAATDWTTVSASGALTCGLRGAGDLYCWGSNEYGEQGDGAAWRATPTVVP